MRIRHRLTLTRGEDIAGRGNDSAVVGFAKGVALQTPVLSPRNLYLWKNPFVSQFETDALGTDCA